MFDSLSMVLTTTLSTFKQFNILFARLIELPATFRIFDNLLHFKTINNLSVGLTPNSLSVKYSVCKADSVAHCI